MSDTRNLVFEQEEMNRRTRELLSRIDAGKSPEEIAKDEAAKRFLIEAHFAETHGVEMTADNRLMCHVISGRASDVKACLDAGANPNMQFKNQPGLVLHYAIDNGDIEVVRLLLEHGVNINIYATGGAKPGGKPVNRYLYKCDIEASMGMKNRREIKTLLIAAGAT